MREVRDTLRDVQDESGWTLAEQLEVLLQWFEQAAPEYAREEACRFVRASASGKRFTPSGRLQRRDLRALMTRSTGLVAAHHVDLTGLSPRALRDLSTVVRHLEQQVYAERGRRRRGLP